MYTLNALLLYARCRLLAIMQISAVFSVCRAIPDDGSGQHHAACISQIQLWLGKSSHLSLAQMSAGQYASLETVIPSSRGGRVTNPTETRSTAAPLKLNDSADSHNVSFRSWLTQVNLDRGVKGGRQRRGNCWACSLKEWIMVKESKMKKVATLPYPRAALRALDVLFRGGEFWRQRNPGMIHHAVGKGQVAMATPAPDLPDQLELARNKRREKTDRLTDRRRGKAGGSDEVGRSERCQKFWHQDSNEQEGWSEQTVNKSLQRQTLPHTSITQAAFTPEVTAGIPG